MVVVRLTIVDTNETILGSVPLISWVRVANCVENSPFPGDRQGQIIISDVQVPEPATWLLLAGGLLVVWMRGRKVMAIGEILIAAH